MKHNKKGNVLRRWKKGQHLKWDHRLIIERMRLDGATTRKIAEALGCSHVTIVKELKRGQYIHTNPDLTTEVRYSPEKAERRCRENLAAKGPQLKIGSDFELAHDLETLIVKKHFSPAAALAAVRANGKLYATSISTGTLYNYIKGYVLNILPRHLPFQKGYRRKGRKKIQKQKRASVGTSIEQRPAEVDLRKSFGHWEMDTVYTSKAKKAKLTPTLLVLTERLTRKEIIMLMRDRTAASVVRSLNALERSMGAEKFSKVFRTITVDNGVEFSDFQGMENSALRKRKARTKVYYCHAHRSYERCSNENANKLIRRHLPKGTDLSKVTQRQVAEIEDWINNYPRRILNWKTANMLFHFFMDRL